jgi:hypothetical protein
MFNFTALIDFPDIFFETTQMMSIPALTPLYPLEPHGIGTGKCESLKSYICRLSDAHRISTRLLMERTISKGMFNKYKHLCCDIRSMRAKTSFFSTGENAKSLIDVLIEDTRVEELFYCTMLPLRKVIGVKGLFAVGERYCPVCLSKSDSVENMYGHLTWELACVTACHIHGVQLQPSQCGASYHNHIKRHARKILSGVCSKCGSIGYLCRKEIPQIASETEIWKATQVAELISCLPKASRVFSRENTIAGLNLLVATFADGMPAVAARRAGIHKSVLWGWIQGNFLPSMGPLLNLCLAAGVSLTSVLNGQPIRCPSPHFHHDGIRKDMPKATAEERENALTQALATNPPTSLEAIAKKVGLCRKTLRYQFPEQTDILVKRYQEYKINEKKEENRKKRNLAANIINELISEKLPLTLRNFQLKLGRPLMPQSKLYKVFIDISQK